MSLSLFHLFPFLFDSFWVFTFFLFMFVSCFNFFYSYFVYLHFFLFIYLFIFFSLLKKYSFSNMFYYENNFKKLLYFFFIRCRFDVWKKKTNLIFFKYGFFSLSFALCFVSYFLSFIF
jgi:hypothetical protein